MWERGTNKMKNPKAATLTQWPSVCASVCSIQGENPRLSHFFVSPERKKRRALSLLSIYIYVSARALFLFGGCERANETCHPRRGADASEWERASLSLSRHPPSAVRLGHPLRTLHSCVCAKRENKSAKAKAGKAEKIETGWNAI